MRRPTHPQLPWPCAQGPAPVSQAVQSSAAHEVAVKVAGYILGEFGYYIADFPDSGCVLFPVPSLCAPEGPSCGRLRACLGPDDHGRRFAGAPTAVGGQRTGDRRELDGTRRGEGKQRRCLHSAGAVLMISSAAATGSEPLLLPARPWECLLRPAGAAWEGGLAVEYLALHGFTSIWVKEVHQTGTRVRHDTETDSDTHSPLKRTVHKRNQFPCSMIMTRRRAAGAAGAAGLAFPMAPGRMPATVAGDPEFKSDLINKVPCFCRRITALRPSRALRFQMPIPLNCHSICSCGFECLARGL